MSQSQADPEPLLRALLRTRVSVLVALAAAGLVLASQPAADPPPLDPNTTGGALALAVASIVARHLSAGSNRPVRGAVASAVASLLLALSVGALGVYIAFSQDARETGILLAFGGFILAIPRPTIAALAQSPSSTKG